MAEHTVSHTVVGDPPGTTDSSVPGVILLNRSSRLLRREFLRELVDAGFQEICTVESGVSYTVESLSLEFPQVRFILVEQSFNTGQAINLAMSYLRSERALLLWSTMGVPNGISRGMDALQAPTGRVCVAPLLRGERGEVLPTVQAPALQRKALRVLSLPVRHGETRTLFPFDYVALYDRQSFLRMGGYDPEISHPFWQKMDFGFRLYLWGGDIPLVPTFRIAFRTLPEAEDQSHDGSYARFFSRNLALRITPQGARIPPFSALFFATRSGLGFSQTFRIFGDARLWLGRTTGYIKIDPRDLVERWSIEHE